MWGKAECIIKSSEKFKDASLGIWASFSVDLCNLILLFFLLFFGLWSAKNQKDRSEHFRFFLGQAASILYFKAFLTFQEYILVLPKFQLFLLRSRMMVGGLEEGQGTEWNSDSVSAQAILCKYAQITYTLDTPMKTKCSDRRTLPCGSTACFLIVFLDHLVIQSDFKKYFKISNLRCWLLLEI